MVRAGSQWLIIHGRRAGKLPAAVGKATGDGLQQPHPLAWCPDCDERCGALAPPSLLADALRRPPSIVARPGVVSSMRGDASPQPGQGCGSMNSSIGRRSVNGPHRAQPYSMPRGFDEDLDQAMRNAGLEVLRLLNEHCGLSRDDAYSLVSAAADFAVTQVVDRRQGVHARICRLCSHSGQSDGGARFCRTSCRHYPPARAARQARSGRSPCKVPAARWSRWYKPFICGSGASGPSGVQRQRLWPCLRPAGTEVG